MSKFEKCRVPWENADAEIWASLWACALCPHPQDGFGALGPSWGLALLWEPCSQGGEATAPGHSLLAHEGKTTLRKTHARFHPINQLIPTTG